MKTVILNNVLQTELDRINSNSSNDSERLLPQIKVDNEVKKLLSKSPSPITNIFNNYVLKLIHIILSNSQQQLDTVEIGVDKINIKCIDESVYKTHFSNIFELTDSDKTWNHVNAYINAISNENDIKLSLQKYNITDVAIDNIMQTLNYLMDNKDTFKLISNCSIISLFKLLCYGIICMTKYKATSFQICCEFIHCSNLAQYNDANYYYYYNKFMKLFINLQKYVLNIYNTTDIQPSVENIKPENVKDNIIKNDTIDKKSIEKADNIDKKSIENTDDKKYNMEFKTNYSHIPEAHHRIIGKYDPVIITDKIKDYINKQTDVINNFVNQHLYPTKKIMYSYFNRQSPTYVNDNNFRNFRSELHNILNLLDNNQSETYISKSINCKIEYVRVVRLAYKEYIKYATSQYGVPRLFLPVYAKQKYNLENNPIHDFGQICAIIIYEILNKQCCKAEYLNLMENIFGCQDVYSLGFKIKPHLLINHIRNFDKNNNIFVPKQEERYINININDWENNKAIKIIKCLVDITIDINYAVSHLYDNERYIVECAYNKLRVYDTAYTYLKNLSLFNKILIKDVNTKICLMTLILYLRYNCQYTINEIVVRLNTEYLKTKPCLNELSKNNVSINDCVRAICYVFDKLYTPLYIPNKNGENYGHICGY